MLQLNILVETTLETSWEGSTLSEGLKGMPKHGERVRGGGVDGNYGNELGA